MIIKLFNSLSNKKEEFRTVEKDKVKMYACGLTVYDKMHIGHARTTIFVDILYRFMKHMYKDVVFVRNITDVDDKINKRAVERGITIQQLTSEVINYVNEDMEFLHNLKPTFEPKATEHIKEIIEIIQKLIDKGYAYVVGGNVMFDINKYKEYGVLSHKDIEQMQQGVRIEVGDYKKNPLDFVLWKPSLDIDDESSRFNSPWGVGRPGWHIECSAMSHKYLGENFDIHCGGVDLKFPHHENEIAQSRCAFDCNFVNFWFHIGSLMVNGEKMSKSLGNFITVEDLKNKNISGTTIRFMMLKNHYRKPFDFKENLLEEAEKNLYSLHENLENIEFDTAVPAEIIKALSDDLNTVEAVAVMNAFNKNKEFKKLKSALNFFGVFDEAFLPQNQKSLKDIDISEKEINDLIAERQQAKVDKNWQKADEIRDFLKSKHIVLLDSKDKVEWKIEDNKTFKLN